MMAAGHQHPGAPVVGALLAPDADSVDGLSMDLLLGVRMGRLFHGGAV
jgi:hypothetical protein